MVFLLSLAWELEDGHVPIFGSLLETSNLSMIMESYSRASRITNILVPYSSYVVPYARHTFMGP